MWGTQQNRYGSTPYGAGEYGEQYQPETTEQIIRIRADGGTVIDAVWMDTVIKTLKTQGIYGNVKFIGDANIAVKKDGVGAVATLYDISGNDNDAVQGTGANQPIWTDGEQNGRAGLVFNGTSHFLRAADFSTPLSQPVSIFCAAKTLDTDAGFMVAGSNVFMLYRRATGKIELFAGAHVAGNVSDLNQHFYSALFNTTSSSLYTDGSFVGSGDVSTNTMPRVVLGADQAPAQLLTGNILVAIVIDDLVTNNQRQALETLINNYYAIY